MAQHINVRPDELRTASKELETQRMQYEEIITKVQQITQNVTANWQGDTQSKFLRDIEQSREVLKVFSAKMQEFSAYLNMAADQIERVDSEVGRK